MLIVVDTNVVVSGLLNAKGSPGKIIDLVMDNQIRVAYDDRILGEYEDVLYRPELHLNHARVNAVISHIELSGKPITPDALPPIGYTDLDDIVFAEVFITSKADALISGNTRHYKPLLALELPVLSPAQFLEEYFPTLLASS
jgi:putative PIN family toxin of toxin-antitoxin system